MHSLQHKLVNSGIKQESHPIFLHFFSGGVNKNEVVLRRGLGLVQMTKRHKIEFPEHSQHFEKKSAKKGPKQYQMKCHERLSLNV